MPPPLKPMDGGRRRSIGKPSLLLTLVVPSSRLRALLMPDSPKVDSSPSKPASDVPEEAKLSPTTASDMPPPSNDAAENTSDSNPAVPPAELTPAPSATDLPVEEGSARKKGTKRSAADGSSRPRGKPGPKKRARMDDGTADSANAGSRPSGAHKLGPKANQGAINAGLRALDRSGKPCRKWSKGGFTLKSFTGVIWAVSRWSAPPRSGPDSSPSGSAAPSVDNSSSKENKENGPEVKSATNSNFGPDAEVRSAPSFNASSPVPPVVEAAAS